MNIQLLQSYKGNKKGDVIFVEMKEGNDLIRQMVATKYIENNYIQETKFGKTKAFKKAPKTK